MASTFTPRLLASRRALAIGADVKEYGWSWMVCWLWKFQKWLLLSLHLWGKSKRQRFQWMVGEQTILELIK